MLRMYTVIPIPPYDYSSAATPKSSRKSMTEMPLPLLHHFLSFRCTNPSNTGRVTSRVQLKILASQLTQLVRHEEEHHILRQAHSSNNAGPSTFWKNIHCQLLNVQ